MKRTPRAVGRRKNSTLRCWDTYWQKKWEEEKKTMVELRKYEIIKLG